MSDTILHVSVRTSSPCLVQRERTHSRQEQQLETLSTLAFKHAPSSLNIPHPPVISARVLIHGSVEWRIALPRICVAFAFHLHCSDVDHRHVHPRHETPSTCRTRKFGAHGRSVFVDDTRFEWIGKPMAMGQIP